MSSLHFTPRVTLDLFLMLRQVERESKLNKMSYSDGDHDKWRKVLVKQLMSSDEFSTEDNQAVFIVKALSWRSDKVTLFYEQLDSVRNACETEQACHQTKNLVHKRVLSHRLAPSGLLNWAVQH